MKQCPRCAEKWREQSTKCRLCGLDARVFFDPTGGHPQGASYLNRMIGGHFRTVSVLAYGGHGMVLLVRHTKLVRNNLFALKLLRPELSRDAAFRKRFLREAEIVYSFSHQNIVPIREFGETDAGELYFTMDFCRGRPLDYVMRGCAGFSLKSILLIFEDILNGLMYAHKQGIVHRDLKPANIFLEQNAHGVTVRLLDFGIAKPQDTGGVEITAANNVVGTPAYMAPEQILGQAVDGRTDLYAIGVIMYRMLSGKPPFEGRTGHEILAKQIRDKPPSLQKLKPELPPAVCDLVERLLAKQPDQRPASAEVMRQQVMALRDQFCTGKERDGGLPAERPGKRGIRLGLAAMALFAAGVCIAGWFVFNMNRQTVEAAPPEEVQEKHVPAAQQKALPPAELTPEKTETMPKRPDPKPALNKPILNKIRSIMNRPLNKRPHKNRPVAHKWCPVCAKRRPAALVTCPECGQVLTGRFR